MTASVSGWGKATEALSHVDSGLKVVDNLMSFVKATKGKPSAKERALFAASVVFTYGIWENYAEQLALELVGRVAKDLQPERVPLKVKKVLEGKTTWELAVSPGWRTLWVDVVRAKALGDEADKYGMNTARVGNVSFLLEISAVADPFAAIPDSICPEHLATGERNVKDAIDALVTLRGSIVHTGKVPDSLSKSHVTAWRNFVQALTKAMDKSCREQCGRLLT